MDLDYHWCYVCRYVLLLSTQVDVGVVALAR